MHEEDRKKKIQGYGCGYSSPREE